jgi:hypothetical protein
VPGEGAEVAVATEVDVAAGTVVVGASVVGGRVVTVVVV